MRLQTPKSHDFGYVRIGAAMLVAVWFTSSILWADPAGSTIRVDQRVTVRIDEQRIGVECSATLNRPGAFQEFMAIDADGDGELSMQEQAKYFDEVRRQIMAGLEITVDGRQLPLRQAGEMMLVMPFTKVFRFEADQPTAWEGGVEIELHNDNFLAQDGDVAIRVEAAGGVSLEYCSLPQQDGEGAPDAAVVPPPSFAPQQQRDVVVRYSGDSKIDSQAATAASEAIEPRNDSPAISIAASLETILLGGGIVALAALAMLVAVAARRGSRFATSRAALTAALACFTVLCAAWSVHGALAKSSGDVAPISDDEAKVIFRGLHENIYSAFQAKTENDVYDVLAASLDGELLSRTYLQVSRLAMSDNTANGFYVRRVKPLQSEVLPQGDAATESGFRVRHRWRVYSVVSHAGHRHARVNEYEATFSVQQHGDDWRITRADLRDCHRADSGLLFASTAP